MKKRTLLRYLRGILMAVHLQGVHEKSCDKHHTWGLLEFSPAILFSKSFRQPFTRNRDLTLKISLYKAASPGCRNSGCLDCVFGAPLMPSTVLRRQKMTLPALVHIIEEPEDDYSCGGIKQEPGGGEATGRNIQEEEAGQWKTKHVREAFSAASQSHN